MFSKDLFTNYGGNMKMTDYVSLMLEPFIGSIPDYLAPFLWIGRKIKEKWDHLSYRLIG